MTYKKAREHLENTKRQPGGFDNNAVYLRHGDGTCFNFKFAVMEELEGHLFIYTEHHGRFVYPLDEVLFYETYHWENHRRIP